MSQGGKAAIQSKDRVRHAPGVATTSATTAPASDNPQNRPNGGCGCGGNGTKTSGRSNEAPAPRQGNDVSTARAASLARREAMSTRGQAAINSNGMSAAQTARGNPVTGNRVGRGSNVTGNEPGTCKNVTGSEYVGAHEFDKFCGPSKITSAETRSGAGRELTGTPYRQAGKGMAPSKVGSSKTLRGGGVTGTLVGRSGNVTGNEPGSCRNVTGDDYVGAEQYSNYCKSAPAPTDRKVGVSSTLMGQAVTGAMTDRGPNVTGNEAGTCKALTGTPYAGAASSEAYCSSPETAMAMARARKGTTNVGPSMTGIQPGINGVMTGAEKGACEPVTGTAYVGADQAASACPASAATPASPDFPQPIAGQPWGEFSVTQPSGGAQQGGSISSVTGSRYEQGHITGPFGMATGKVTGTEEARFDNKAAAMPAAPIPATTEWVDGRVKSRITGEGMDVGLKITGDDWERNERVTGTEGMSATRRNPTLRGPTASMAVENKRNEAVPVPVSKVTGSSGNTEKGSLITYSGGARG
jgi:hypothetical protein